MKVLGIDPGTKKTGLVLYDSECNKVLEKEILENHESVRWVRKLAHEDRVDIAGIEMMACMGMTVGQETFEACAWIGHWERVLWDLGKETRKVYRVKVKCHHCGSSRATDSNISQALKDRFPATGGGADPWKGIKKQPGPLYGMKSHMWSALAIAMYTADNYSFGV
jgi:hypothetical protein